MKFKISSIVFIFLPVATLFLTSIEGCRKNDDALIPVLNPISLAENFQSAISINGKIIYQGGLEITARGVCWGTKANPTIADFKTFDGTGAGEYHSVVSGLNPSTLYYIRAYATTSAGTFYGKEKIFVTQAGQVPELKTNSIGKITRTSASCDGEVISEGGLPVTLRGVCYGKAPFPTLSDNYTNNGTGSGIFTATMSGMDQGTTYYVRAFASNEAGTTYGNQISFSTTEMPALVTSPAFFIKGTLAKAGGIIKDNGGAEKLITGLCWSTSSGPDLTSSYNTSLAFEMTGLIPNTIYFVRAYATNSAGTAYGNEISFNSGYEVGTSLGGGIVFYNDGLGHGLICASEDQSISAQWGCYGSVIGSFSNDIRSGKENTAKIVEKCENEGYAAKLCNDLIFKKYSDWYLPSTDELVLMYQNLYMHKIGNLYGHYYWSSSEYGDIQAWLMDFTSGILYYSSKSLYLSVRAIRTF